MLFAAGFAEVMYIPTDVILQFLTLHLQAQDDNGSDAGLQSDSSLSYYMYLHLNSLLVQHADVLCCYRTQKQ